MHLLHLAPAPACLECWFLVVNVDGEKNVMLGGGVLARAAAVINRLGATLR